MSELSALQLIRPDWPSPENVRAFTTTRTGGFSTDQWHNLNLGSNCGDDPQYVKHNRQLLRTLLPADPHWLEQVHGKHVITLNGQPCLGPEADAMVAKKQAQVCAILHADCLPVLFCNRAGTQVAAAHAGWRGLLKGVIEATVLAMNCNPGELMAWLGPAIGQQQYEVGLDVFDLFVEVDSQNSFAFRRHRDRWLADLYKLARLSLARVGIKQVFGGQHCTFKEEDKFFSFRRDGVTGRMASVIWLDP